MLRHVLVPIHSAGWPFIGLFFLAAIILGWFATPLFWIGLIATAWCVYFFRDPARVTPVGDSLVISPADGQVEAVVEAKAPPELQLGDTPLTRISVFLSVFDVHVNRMPIGGRVLISHHHAGKFLNAALDKASEENERQSLLIELADGRQVGVVQIAGLVARRIICNASEGAVYETGERFGLIRFGSRLDVYLPRDIAPQVIVGQRAVAGETILADMGVEGPAREGRHG